MSRINLVPSLNGTEPKAKKERKQPKKAPQKKVSAKVVIGYPTLSLVVTIMLGIFIPALSLYLSTVTGKLAFNGGNNQDWVLWSLSGFGLAVGGTVLAVSLRHLQFAVQMITRSSDTESWLLAIAIDLTIVLSEMVQVFAPNCGLTWLTLTALVVVTTISMALNVWAFLLHRE